MTHPLPYPGDAVRIASRGLWSDFDHLRGTVVSTTAYPGHVLVHLDGDVSDTLFWPHEEHAVDSVLPAGVAMLAQHYGGWA